MDFTSETLNESVDVIGEINSQQNHEQQNEETVEKNPKKRGRGPTSSVWNYFQKLPNDRALCKACGKDLAGGGNRMGTSSLIRHVDLCNKIPKTFAETEVGKLVVDHAGKLRA